MGYTPSLFTFTEEAGSLERWMKPINYLIVYLQKYPQ